MLKKPLFIETFSLLTLVAILHALAIHYYLYWTIDEFDSLMHFLGGAWVGVATLWLYFFSGWFAPMNRSLKNFFIIGLLGLVFVAVAWEIFELVTGTAGVDWKDYPFDTGIDFVMDTLGCLAAIGYAYWREKKLRPLWQL